MAEDEVSGGGGSSKILLIVGLVLGLGAGGGATYFLVGGQQQAAPVEEEVPVEEVITDKKMLSVKLDRIAVPIYGMKRGRREFLGNYFLEISLETDDDSDFAAIDASQHRVRQAFLEMITARSFLREDDSLQIDYAKAQKAFRDEANAVLGSGVVDRVTIINSIRVSS